MAHIPAQSDWAARTFDMRASKLRELIPAALARAHDRARSAHEAAEATTSRTYGNVLWEAQFEEMVSALEPIDGVRRAKMRGYELALLVDHVFFPLRCDSAAEVDQPKPGYPVSEQRRRLFHAHGLEAGHQQPFLDESLADLTPEVDAFPQLGANTRLVVVAYAVDQQVGVLRIAWGLVEYVENRELRWGERSDLPVATEEGRRRAR